VSGCIFSILFQFFSRLGLIPGAIEGRTKVLKQEHLLDPKDNNHAAARNYKDNKTTPGRPRPPTSTHMSTFNLVAHSLEGVTILRAGLSPQQCQVAAEGDLPFPESIFRAIELALHDAALLEAITLLTTKRFGPRPQKLEDSLLVETELVGNCVVLALPEVLDITLNRSFLDVGPQLVPNGRTWA
jgi:hypothetical protein